MALAARKTEFVNICTFVLISNFACRLCVFPKSHGYFGRKVFTDPWGTTHAYIQWSHRAQVKMGKRKRRKRCWRQTTMYQQHFLSSQRISPTLYIQFRGKLLALKELRVKGETARQKSACPKDSLDALSTLPFRARWIFPKERKAKVVKDEKMGQVKDEETALLCHWKA